ncbi:hypothetical protein [Puniceicoccus vermicola]|uniref:Uncharacterized protein n=1 Tax=Puniceicoccus vermicola TaxID=388746 RepID=A0A7X1AW95_9BACT|nr:hypothetical protein [Puniceicoccus vermicola]MBC2600238.1 hypothetical protein [Puniceicoccus vermicola]
MSHPLKLSFQMCCLSLSLLFVGCQKEAHRENEVRAPSSEVSDERSSDTSTILSHSVIERALEFSAPYWDFRPAKRSHHLNHTFGFYTLCLEAYLEQKEGRTQESWLIEAVISRLRPVLVGGSEPECQGGLGGWSHGAFAWSLAYIRHTHAVWDALSPEEQKKAELLMGALAVAACYTLDDDNDYHALLDGSRNFGKEWNPNHVEGYVAVGMASSYFFTEEILRQRLRDFDFDSYLEELREAGFTNIVDCWTQVPGTRQALMEGGEYQGNDPTLDYGNGAGVHGNTYTYQGFSLDQAWAIYRKLASRMYSHTARTEIPVTNKEGLFTHILAKDGDGEYLISPYDGQFGMCFEFDTRNAKINGTRFRSSLSYVYEGWMNNMATAAAIWAFDDWEPISDEDRSLMDAIYIGSEDFLYKVKYGYSGFANGEEKVVRSSDFEDKPRGWIFVLSWWHEIVQPLVDPRRITQKI